MSLTLRFPRITLSAASTIPLMLVIWLVKGQGGSDYWPLQRRILAAALTGAMLPMHNVGAESFAFVVPIWSVLVMQHGYCPSARAAAAALT